MLEKSIICRNFSKGAVNYDNYALVQSKMAEKTSNLIYDCENKKILEIGCGTGIFTGILINKFKNSEFTLIDISNEMINLAKKKFYKYKNINYINIDAEKYETNEKYDYILSNATFQWFLELEKSLKKFKEMLFNKGELIFSIFGVETFKELREAFQNAGYEYNYTQHFYSKEELKSILIDIFKEVYIEEEYINETYNDLMTFLRYIKNIGASSGIKNKKIITKRVIENIEKKYLELFGEIKVTNHIFYLKCRKDWI